MTLTEVAIAHNWMVIKDESNEKRQWKCYLYLEEGKKKRDRWKI